MMTLHFSKFLLFFMRWKIGKYAYEHCHAKILLIFNQIEINTFMHYQILLLLDLKLLRTHYLTFFVDLKIKIVKEIPEMNF